MKALSVIFLVWVACFCLSASASEDGGQQCDLAVNVAFDQTGNLWRVVVKDRTVQVDVSDDLAKTFSKPVTLNTTIEKTGMVNCTQPKIALGPEGTIYIAWTEQLNSQSSGNIWLSRSINAGKSFDKPMLVYQGRAVAVSVNVAFDGKVTLVWNEAAGSELEIVHYAVSINGGQSFGQTQKLVDGVSSCDAILMTNKPDGAVTVMLQHQFDGGESDYLLIEIPETANQPPVIQRATFGHGKNSACAISGSALAIGGVGQNWWGYHMAYFSDNLKKAGLYYSRMDGVAWASSPAKRIGDVQHQASQPAMLSLGDDVWLVWRELYGENYQILGVFSDDGGRSWQGAKLLATTNRLGGRPQLIAKNKQVYLVLSAPQEGLRLIALSM